MRSGGVSMRWVIAVVGFFVTGWPVLTGRADPFDPGVLFAFFATWTLLVLAVVFSAPSTRDSGPEGGS